LDWQGTFVKETAVTFAERNSLVGIVTDPAPVAIHRSPLGVILLNPGIVHRVGPGRIYVKIARALAAQGFLSLRFDFSGIGDSGVRHDHLPFERSAADETRAAMDCLGSIQGIDNFILLGGCSGGEVALRTAGCDPRVRHAILINFPVASDEGPQASSERATRTKAHYYWNFALFNPRSWQKIFSGQAEYRLIFDVLRAQLRERFSFHGKVRRSETRFAQELRDVTARGVSLSFVCAQGDAALDDLREAAGDEVKRLCASGAVSLEIIPRSDHTFSSLHDQERLVKVVVDCCRVIQTPSRVQHSVQESPAQAPLPAAATTR
jgi:pimeloyl-ACP methyl ester carboxylesterase